MTRVRQWATGVAMCLALSGCATSVGRAAVQPGEHQLSPSPAAISPDVEWAPLQPTYPEVPRRRVPPSPDPSFAQGAPACRASDLDATAQKEGVGGGMWMVHVTFQLVGHQPCHLGGHPDVVMLDQGHPVDVPVEDSSGDSSLFNYPSPVLVDADHPAVLSMTWGGGWCTEPVKTDRVRVALPGEGGSFTVKGFGSSPFCNGEPGSGPTPVVVSAFAPQRRTPGRTESAYADVAARLSLSADFSGGEPLEFTVTLTARKGDVVLAPCPDYSINQYSRGVSPVEERWSLNCDDVPYRDGTGRPFLPAGKPVTFAMHTTTVAELEAVKFIWQLEVPEPVAASPVH
ncbi:MAG: DUF4232 domain-containing protein [Nocardioidaceae bacterium]